MMKTALVLAAAAGGAYAQSCKSSSTKTIDSQQDAAGLSGCATYTGNIAIATGVAGHLEIPGVRKIKGNLTAQAVPKLSRLVAADLEIIEGGFVLEDVEVLDTISLPKLVEVDEIRWHGLPGLQNAELNSGLKKAPRIDIQNTGLSTIESILPAEVEYLEIANNGNINKIDIQQKNITNKLRIGVNGDRLEVNLPEMTWAQDISISGASNVSLPKIERIEGYIAFSENRFTSLSLPKLVKVEDSLTIVGNDELKKTSFPKLEEVDGAFRIGNNTKLNVVSGFPQLEKVGAAFDLFGNFTEVDIPKLKSVAGAYNLRSTEDIADYCDEVQKQQKDDRFVKGKLVCAGKLENPTGEGTAIGDSKDGGSGASLNRVSAVFLSAAVGLGSIALL